MKFLIYYFLTLFFALTVLSSGVIDSQDGFQYLAVARNIYYTGKPTSPVYEYDTRKNIHMNVGIGRDGNTYGATGLGFSLAFLPAVFVTDMVYKVYLITPPVHFPLENDWLILLTSSFTNAFFGALLGVVIFSYLLLLGLKKKTAIFISLVGIFSTNLLVYTKHSFAHMMFLTFLFLSFFFIKYYFKTRKKRSLIFSGLSFGVGAIAYNQSFFFVLIPLIIYFLILSKFKISKLNLKHILYRSILFLIGILPFALAYLWFENQRAAPEITYNNPATLAQVGLRPFNNLPVTVFFEGIYGQLFSPGRSFFLYSPIILTILIFWYKLKKNILPELIVLLILSAIFVIYLSTLHTYGAGGRGIAGFWHGESSWGPRYLTILIPFALLIVGWIYARLKKIQKIIIFYPLILIGLYIQFLGVLLPYQTKTQGLDPNFFVNSTEYTNYVYSNLLPRYSPIIMQSRSFYKKIKELPATWNNGQYNVKFYDGIDFPFLVGTEKWRTIESEGFISLDNKKTAEVNKISIGLINHPIEESSLSATLQVSLNGINLLKQEEMFKPTDKKIIDLNISQDLLKANNNQLIIKTAFNLDNTAGKTPDDLSKYENKTIQPKEYIPQIIGLYSFSINDKPVNIESLNIPYVSDLGPKLAGVEYQNWGGENKDPWKTWNIHTQTYERLPDFWWFRNLYYWDIPKSFTLSLLALNLVGLIFAAIKLKKHLND